MAPFASREQLAATEGVTLNMSNPAEAAKADRVLEKATNAIIADLRWDPRQSERTLNLPRERQSRGACREWLLMLPALRVTAVAVVIDGATLSDVDWRDSGIVYLDRPVRTTGQVTYTAGWAAVELPTVLVDVCCDMAMFMLDNPRGLREWQVGEVREAYFAASTHRVRDPRLMQLRLQPEVA